MKLRIADAADIPAIDALVQRAYPVLLAPDYPAELLQAAVPLMARTGQELLADGTYFVAERGGQIVGAAGWTHAAPGSHKRIAGLGHIRKLVVDSAAQRQGIAQRLIDHTHQSAKRAGMSRMTVLSTHTAVPFYRAMGYRGDEGIQVTLGHNSMTFPAIVMARVLLF